MCILVKYWEQYRTAGTVSHIIKVCPKYNVRSQTECLQAQKIIFCPNIEGDNLEFESMHNKYALEI